MGSSSSSLYCDDSDSNFIVKICKDNPPSVESLNALFVDLFDQYNSVYPDVFSQLDVRDHDLVVFRQGAELCRRACVVDAAEKAIEGFIRMCGDQPDDPVKACVWENQAQTMINCEGDVIARIDQSLSARMEDIHRFVEDFVQEWCDCRALEKKLFTKDYLVHLMMQKKRETFGRIEKRLLDLSIESMEHFFDSGEPWVVRIAVVDMNYRPFDGNLFKNIVQFPKWAYAQYTKWGIIHLGIQIGPYLIDVIESHGYCDVRIKPLSSDRIIMLLYPPDHSGINIQDENNRNIIVDHIQKWRRKRYDIHRSNCQMFVDEFLKELGIRKSWERDGPIGRFLHSIKRCTTKKGEYHLDLFGNERVIESHDDLLEFWDQCWHDIEKLGTSEKASEVIHLFKSLERAYQVQGKHIDKEKLLSLSNWETKQKRTMNHITVQEY
eukprot:TRINITY_DN1830_c0_g1_i2.p1 TRINITY_DN1830_c0_g1~~TRINITY_DN1830_c0_g1_i2.p1  ORF type:complete len:448 (+),score=68.63 TRINITY_DN1830_c0_g1_i2:39-1346(+)